MGLLRRKRRQARQSDPDESASYADVGVPELVDPLYARALVLAVDRGVAVVEVEPPGRDPYRAEVHSGTDPHGFTGMVIRWRVPVIVDAADPAAVHLLEAPCGPDLPLVPDEVTAIRAARDARTDLIAMRYPPPSPAALVALMAPTASAAHPAWDAVCYCLGLLTTGRALAILDGIRADGNSWERAEADLYAWGPGVADDARTRVGAFLNHLGDVAPQGRTLDLAPFWTFGVAALMRDLHPDEVDRAVFARVMAPFVDVCGDLPEELR